MNRLKVKDQPYLFRDTESNGIINTNDSEYSDYLRRKRQSKLIEEERIDNENRLNKLESDVVELKQGINKILELLTK